MKKIIKNKLYNTDTAKIIGEWYNNETGLSYCKETLYQKRTGEFFLLGEGGAMTKYSKECGNGTWSGNTKIIPMTWDSARQWAEEHLTADEYIDAFGDIEYNENKKKVTLSLSIESIEKAKRSAVMLGMNLSAYIESLI